MSGYAVILALALFSGGCARSQMQKILPHVNTMVVAHHYFGYPTRSETLTNGTIRHEWVLDRAFQHPGGIETQKIYVGHDRDGYRKYIEKDVYVKPWVEQQYCRLQIIADENGRVLDSAWEGRSCDDLPRVKSMYQ